MDKIEVVEAEVAFEAEALFAFVKLYFEFARHEEGQWPKVEVAGVGDVVNDGALFDALVGSTWGRLSALTEEQQNAACK